MTGPAKDSLTPIPSSQFGADSVLLPKTVEPFIVTGKPVSHGVVVGNLWHLPEATLPDKVSIDPLKIPNELASIDRLLDAYTRKEDRSVFIDAIRNLSSLIDMIESVKSIDDLDDLTPEFSRQTVLLQNTRIFATILELKETPELSALPINWVDIVRDGLVELKGKMSVLESGLAKFSQTPVGVQAEIAASLQWYFELILNDAKKQVSSQQVNAAWAVYSVCELYAGAVTTSDVSAQRQRAEDFRAMAKYATDFFSGKRSDQVLGSNLIVLGKTIQLPSLHGIPETSIAALLPESIGSQSHAVLISSDRGNPVVALGSDIFRLASQYPNGTKMIVNGFTGVIIFNPDESQINSAIELAERIKRDLALRVEAVTFRGEPIEILSNVSTSSRANLDLVSLQGVGIGLVRTETYLSNGPDTPKNEQFHFYKLLHEVADKVIIRLYDLTSADVKVAQHQELESAGLIDIRYGLTNHQITEFLDAALEARPPERPLWIMFPMVETDADALQFHTLISDALDYLPPETRPKAKDINMVIQIESQKGIQNLRGMLDEVAIACVAAGTNDLTARMQNNLNRDKDLNHYDPNVYRELNEMFSIVSDFNSASGTFVKVEICGQLASSPEFMPILLGIGFRQFSVDLHCTHEIARTIKAADERVEQIGIQNFGSFIQTVLKSKDSAEVRLELNKFWGRADTSPTEDSLKELNS